MKQIFAINFFKANNINKTFQYFLIILLLNGLSKSITLGHPNASVKILITLDISDHESLKLVWEIIEAIKLYCFNPFQKNQLFLNIIITSDNYDVNTRFLVNYLFTLDYISFPSNNCLSCSLNKFFRALDFISKVSKEYEKLVDYTYDEFTKQISNTVSYIDKRIIDTVLKDYSEYEIQSYNSLYVHIFPEDTPMVYVNGIFVSQSMILDKEFWLKIFRNNNFSSEGCDDPEGFLKNFQINYY